MKTTLVLISLSLCSWFATATPRVPYAATDLALSDVPADRSGGLYFSDAEQRSAGMDEVNTSGGQYDSYAFYDGQDDVGGCARDLGDDDRP